MLDDLTKEIKAQLYERVKSPLFGAFALSWAAWNYRPILAVLSGMRFEEKLKYLDSLYPSMGHWAGYCFGGPLLTAVVFLLAYPYPARWMYRYWANQHKELKKVQQEIEDETPLTQEEARALRKTSLVQAAELEAEIAKQRQLVKELNERLRIAAEDTLRIATERDLHAEAAKKANEELSQHMAEVFHGEAPLASSEAIRAAAKLFKEEPGEFQKYANSISYSSRLPNPKKKASEKPIEDEAGPSPTVLKGAMGPPVGTRQHDGAGTSGGSEEAFSALCRLDGATTEELAELLEWSVNQTQRALSSLVKEGRAVRSGGLWALSDMGKYAKEAQWTSFRA